MSWVDVTTAIGTAGAAVVALGLGLRGIYLDHLRKRDEELRQARLVMVSEPFLIATPEHPRAIAVKVYNYSDEPIHDVSVRIDIWQGGDTEVPPDDSEGVEWDFLAPREEREIVFRLPQEGSVKTNSPELRFLDSSGRRFERRSTQSKPQRILHDPQLVLQIVDGEAIITEKQQESRIKSIVGKVIPWKAANKRLRAITQGTCTGHASGQSLHRQAATRATTPMYGPDGIRPVRQ